MAVGILTRTIEIDDNLILEEPLRSANVKWSWMSCVHENIECWNKLTTHSGLLSLYWLQQW